VTERAEMLRPKRGFVRLLLGRVEPPSQSHCVRQLPQRGSQEVVVSAGMTARNKSCLPLWGRWHAKRDGEGGDAQAGEGLCEVPACLREAALSVSLRSTAPPEGEPRGWRLHGLACSSPAPYKKQPMQAAFLQILNFIWNPAAHRTVYSAEGSCASIR